MHAAPEPDAHARDLAERRADARAAKDFATADALRDELAAEGWTVVDEPEGWHLEPLARRRAGSARAGRRARGSLDPRSSPPPRTSRSTGSARAGPRTSPARSPRSGRTRASRDVQYVVADVTDQPDGAFGDDVEVLRLEAGTGWGAARNAGLKRSRRPARRSCWTARSRPTGDVFGPLEAALDDPTVGIVRAVRHRHAGPARVRRAAGAGTVRRGRGLLHGVPSRHARRRPGSSTRSSAGTGPPTSSARSA